MGKLMIRGLVCALGFAVVTSSLPPTTAAATTAAKRIVFLGDSLTAGFGLREDQAYPSLIAEKIRDEHLPYEVVNAGLSGDTSAGGLRRIEWLLQDKIDVLVIALGANDGLRGLSPDALEKNLQAIIDKTKAKFPSVQVVIAGMRMPPNLGDDYAEKFRRVFADLAKRNHAALIPFLLADVGGNRDLNQSDSIHPTAAGQKIIAETVWETLKPLLEQK